jgi:hypothetical protein
MVATNFKSAVQKSTLVSEVLGRKRGATYSFTRRNQTCSVSRLSKIDFKKEKSVARSYFFAGIKLCIVTTHFFVKF